MRIFKCYFVVTLLIFSCKKGDTSGVVDFIIKSSDTIGLTATEEQYVPIEVVQISGRRCNITLSASNVPAGVTILFTPALGEGSYKPVMVIKSDDKVKEGVYPVDIIASCENGVERRQTIKLSVQKRNSQKLIGTWTLAEESMDDNQNGIFEDNEIDSSPLFLQVTFEANGKALIVHHDGDSFLYFWSLTDEVILDLALYQLPIASTSIIDRVDSVEFVLREMNGPKYQARFLRNK